MHNMYVNSFVKLILINHSDVNISVYHSKYRLSTSKSIIIIIPNTMGNEQ